MKRLFSVLTFILLFAVSLLVWNIFSSVRRIEQFAQEVKPGIQVTDARLQARQMGLKYISSSRRDEAGHFRDLVTSSGIMGRFFCEVQHDGNVVISAKKGTMD